MAQQGNAWQNLFLNQVPGSVGWRLGVQLGLISPSPWTGQYSTSGRPIYRKITGQGVGAPAPRVDSRGKHEFARPPRTLADRPVAPVLPSIPGRGRGSKKAADPGAWHPFYRGPEPEGPFPRPPGLAPELSPIPGRFSLAGNPIYGQGGQESGYGTARGRPWVRPEWARAPDAFM